MASSGTFGEFQPPSSRADLANTASARTVSEHAQSVLDELLAPPADANFLAENAAGRVTTWPDKQLAAIVGRRDTVVRDLDLSWLHRFEGVALAVDVLASSIGDGREPRPPTSGHDMLTTRATLLDLVGSGPIGAGGSCRMMRASDGWVAVSMPRRDDFESAAAWLQSNSAIDTWQELTPLVARRSSDELVGRASLLGLAVSQVPEESTQPKASRKMPIVTETGRWKADGRRSPLVVDLSSLWAGPLCGWHLHNAGATVLKVESTGRPDGARRGSPAFYGHLNAQKRLVEIDFRSNDGLAELHSLISDADIVIEASRPRALAALGIDAASQARAGAIWCSLTAYGRNGDAGMRIGFGDDVAAGAGLATYVDGEPWFIGDAAADPISGTTAAAAVLALWSRGASGLIDLTMHDAVATLTNATTVWSSL